jgi:hypothetical protein
MKAFASIVGILTLSAAGAASASPGGSHLAKALFSKPASAQSAQRYDFDDFRRGHQGRGNGYGHGNGHGNGYGHGHDRDDDDHGHAHGGHDNGHGHEPGHGGGHCRGHHDDFCGPASP